MGRRAGKGGKKKGFAGQHRSQRLQKRRKSPNSSSKRMQRNTQTVDAMETSFAASEAAERMKLIEDATLAGTLPSPRGLNNLGNTCFFNAVMQSLARVSRLRDYFVGLPEPDGEEGRMTRAFREYMLAQWAVGGSNVFNPQKLFLEIGKRAPRFKGRQQQDSHEALRFILDGMIEEEKDRIASLCQSAQEDDVASSISSCSSDSSTDTVSISPPPESSVINSIFSGVLASTITCRECQTSSTVTEPFLDLSVPLVSKSSLEDAPVQSSTKQHPVSEASLPIPLPPPPAARESSTAVVAARTTNPTESLRDELLQRVNQVSPIDSEVDEEERLSVSAAVNDKDDSSDSDERFPQIDDLFSMDWSGPESAQDSPEEHSETPESMHGVEDCLPFIGPLQRPESEAKTELEAGSEVKAESEEKVESEVKAESEAKQEKPSTRAFQLSFPLRRCKAGSDKYGSIQDSIREFTKTELLEGDNSYGCEECTRRRRHSQICNSGLGRIERSRGSILTDAEDAMSEVTSEDNVELTFSREPMLTDIPLDDTSSPISSSESDNDDEVKLTNRCRAGTYASGNMPPLEERGTDEMAVVQTQDDRRKKSCGKEADIPTVRTRAEKRLEIRSVPPGLIIHLKRFQQVGMRGSTKKIPGHVEFPFELDLASFMEDDSKIKLVRRRNSTFEDGQKYLLTGVVVHGGSLFGGHYTAYVRAGETKNHKGGWYHCSDTKVTKAKEKEVLAAEAYILFYERVSL